MDLERLRPVFEESGPFVTLHLDVGRATENAGAREDSRWTTVRHELERAGLSESLTAELGERVRENTHVPGEVRRTVVAAGERILLDDVQPGHHPHPEVVDVDVLPELTAWIDAEDQALPFVLAVVDREGGDVQAYRASSRPPVDEESVTGQTFYITKVAEGDWAQKQFQQTAENRWRHNATLVAEAVRDLARSHRARVVLIAGEVRARAEVERALESLDHGIEPVIQLESGGRAAGASADAMWNEIRDRLRSLVAAGDADVTARVDEARGRGERVATGLDEVLEAFVNGQVEELVADLDHLRERTVKPAQHAGLPLPASAASAQELPADRVLVAAAALTGARLTVVPAAMAHGGGASALLRWDDG